MCKGIKRVLLSVACAVMLLSVFGAFAAMKGAVKVKAASGDVEYTMVGASVRTIDPSGLRFTAAISKADYETLKGDNTDITYGLAFVPTDYIEKYGDLNAENIFGVDPKYGEGKAPIVNQRAKELYYNEIAERYELRVVLTGLSTEQLITDFSAVSYYILGADTEPTYYFGETYCVRNAAQVATAAIADPLVTEKDTLESLVKKAYTENTKIKTAEHLHYLLTHKENDVGLMDINKVYTLEKDIDMSALDAVSGDEHNITMFATLDGKGHKISNLAYNGTAIRHSRGATIKNVVFENVSAKATNPNATSFVSLFHDTFGITVENVYMTISVDGNNSSVAFVSAIFDNTNVDATSEEKVSLKNVVAKFTSVTNASQVDALSVTRKFQTKDNATVTAEYENVYMVNGSSINGGEVLNQTVGNVSATVNGKSYDNAGLAKNAMNAESTVKAISLLYPLRGNFTSSIWTDILVVDATELEGLGYTVIDSKEDLTSMIKDLGTVTQNKYALVTDIDATDVEASNLIDGSSFYGEINGLGHNISNLKITGCLIKTLNGTIKDIAFVNTEFAKSPLNTIGLANQVASSADVVIKNVYVDMVITATEETFVSPFGGSINGSLTVTNSVAKIGFTESAAVPTAIGAIWMVNATNKDVTVDMNNVYLIKGDNFGTKTAGLASWLRSKNQHKATINVVNGLDSKYVQENAASADMKDGYPTNYLFDSYGALTAAEKDYEKALTSEVFDSLKV